MSQNIAKFKEGPTKNWLLKNCCSAITLNCGLTRSVSNGNGYAQTRILAPSALRAAGAESGSAMSVSKITRAVGIEDTDSWREDAERPLNASNCAQYAQDAETYLKRGP